MPVVAPQFVRLNTLKMSRLNSYVSVPFSRVVLRMLKSKFLTIGCSLQPPRNALVIHAPAGEALATEAEFELPCDAESCSARWDHQSWISVTCVPRDGGGKKGKEFVLMRGSNGAWSKFGR